MNKVKSIINKITNILFVFYPFIIYLSLHYQHVELAIFYLIFLFVLRLITLPKLFSNIKWLSKVVTCFGLLLTIISWLFSKYQLLLFYPVAINLIFFIVFSYSLTQPQTIIEKFAEMKDRQLPDQAVQYIRNVTIFWCIFFIFNGTIALATCLLENIYWWTIYNGLISYLLIGICLGVEWLIRQKFQR